MSIPLPKIEVSASRSLIVDNIETIYEAGSQTLTHVLEVEQQGQFSVNDEQWSLVYCGIRKAGGLYQVQVSMGDDVRGIGVSYRESSMSLLAENDLGLESLTEVLSVPLISKGLAYRSSVQLKMPSGDVFAFEGAFMFVSESTKTVHVVMVEESFGDKEMKGNKWIDLKSTDDNLLSYVLTCLKHAID